MLLNSKAIAELELKYAKTEDLSSNEALDFVEALRRCKRFLNTASKSLDMNASAEETRSKTQDLIDKFVSQLAYPVKGYEKKREELAQALKDEITDYGIITELLMDESVDEVRINSRETIVYEKGGEPHFFHKQFDNDDQIERVISRLLGESRLTEVKPFINARTTEGYRVNATHKSISPVNEYSVVIRKFKKKKLEVSNLMKMESLSLNMYKFLRLLPRAFFSWFTVGATGSGKTVLNELLIKDINPNDRAIFIENPSEIFPEKRDPRTGRIINDFLRLEAKSADKGDSRDAHAPTMENLLENALRQTPKWVVPGEIRAAEEFRVALQASQTGHYVISTFHAEDPEDAIYRYLTSIMSISNEPAELVMKNICRSFKFIINQKRFPDGSRKVAYITEILGVDEQDKLKPVLNHIYKYEIEKVLDPEPGKTHGKIIGRHRRVGKISQETVERLRNAGIPDSQYKFFTTEPSLAEEEVYHLQLK